MLAVALSAIGPVSAAPAKNAPTKAPAKKIIDLKYCPMTMEDASPSKKSIVEGNYRVNFCCPGCDSEFKSLTPKQKQEKIAAILKKQNAKKPAA